MVEHDLQEKLAELRARHCAQLPTPEIAVLSRATARLRREGILQRCLQQGETAPDFEFIDRLNRPATLYGLLAEKPVVVKFFRGFWCPFCRTELEAYEKIQGELEALGCDFLAISPQQLSAATKNLPVIFDRNNAIANRFGIVYTLSEDEIGLLRGWGVELDQLNQSGDWALPLPATYLIDTDRTVTWQFIDADFRERCCPDELIEEARHCSCS